MKKFGKYLLGLLLAAPLALGGASLSNSIAFNEIDEVGAASMPTTDGRKQVVMNITSMSSWWTTDAETYIYMWNEETTTNESGESVTQETAHRTAWPGDKMQVQNYTVTGTDSSGNETSTTHLVAFLVLEEAESWDWCKVVRGAYVTDEETSTTSWTSYNETYNIQFERTDAQTYTAEYCEKWLSQTNSGDFYIQYGDWYASSKMPDGYYVMGDGFTWAWSSLSLNGYLGNNPTSESPLSLVLNFPATTGEDTGFGFKIISVKDAAWTWMTQPGVTTENEALYGTSEDYGGLGYLTKSDGSSNFYIWGAASGYDYELTYDGTNLAVKRDEGTWFVNDIANVTASVCLGDSAPSAGWDNKPEALTAERWTYLYNRYTETLTENAQTEFKDMTSEEATDALARYDMIYNKYISGAPSGTFSFDADFLGRATSTTSSLALITSGESGSYIAVIAVISLSALAIGAYIFTKKKETEKAE